MIHETGEIYFNKLMNEYHIKGDNLIDFTLWLFTKDIMKYYM